MTTKTASTATFEQAWAVKEKEGYQYGEDALEQVRFGWELRAQQPETLKTFPPHVTESITEEDITPEDRAIVAAFYKDACHAEWCEYDWMMLLYVVARSRMNGEAKK